MGHHAVGRPALRRVGGHTPQDQGARQGERLATASSLMLEQATYLKTVEGIYLRKPDPLHSLCPYCCVVLLCSRAPREVTRAVGPQGAWDRHHRLCL